MIVLAFVIGAVVVTAVTVLLLRLVQSHWRIEATDGFIATVPADEVQARLRSIATGHRGWRVHRTPTPDAIVIKCRTTPWTWTKIIECRVQSQGPATSAIALSCTTPQFYDWGECRRTVEFVRAALAA
jgi:hypothetical protein